MPLISVVIPMHNEEAVLTALFARLKNCLEPITPDYEIV